MQHTTAAYVFRGLQEFLRKWKDRSKVKELMDRPNQVKKIAEEELEVVARIGQGISASVYRGISPFESFLTIAT